MPSKETKIKELEKELKETKEQLGMKIEEFEAANEELRCTNDELQAVNQKLESKVEELNRANSDLKNLMEATELAILIADSDCCIQRFTTSTKEIFNIEESDKGSPLQYVTHRLKYNSLEEDMAYVLDIMDEVEKVVSDRDGRTYMMCLRPYRTMEDKVEGVVLTFTEITRLNEAEEKLKQQKLQESLAMMGTYALGKNDLASIMHRAIQQVCVGLDADYAVLLTLERDKNALQLFDYTGWNPDEKQRTKVKPNPKWDIGYALKKDRLAVVTNYSEEDRFNISPLMDHLKIQSGISIKITESDEVCGILGVYSKEKRVFTEDELNFIQIASNIIGAASESTKAKKSLKKTNRQLQEEIERSKKYQREILQNSIVERWNLGGYLHDTLAQILVSIKVMVSSMGAELEESDMDMSSQINLILENIDEGIKGIRNLTHEIIPVDIEEEGVEHAFRLLVRQLQKTHDVNCILEIDNIVEKIKDKKVATNLYHVIQEAVKNAAIHGEAENVIIETAKEKENLTLRITDDGIGLSNTEYKKGEGSGTNIMRHRIELLGGSFKMAEIGEENSTGTRITCKLPLDSLGSE